MTERTPRAGSGGRSRALLQLLPLLVATAGCSSRAPEEEPRGPGPAVSFVELAPKAPSLFVGQTLRMEAYPTDALGEDLEERAIAWSSAVEEVATVDAAGLVEALVVGTTRIRASVEGVEASVPLRVLPAPIGRIALEPSSFELVEGERVWFHATAIDVWGKEVQRGRITWSSDAPEIAEVDQEGLVRALRSGAATIFAEREEVRGSAAVLVNRPPVQEVILEQQDLELLAGRAFQLEAMARDAQGLEIHGAPIGWSSSDPAVASVDDEGLLHAWRPGEATITAFAGLVRAQATVTVLELSIERLRMEPEEASLLEGESVQLRAVPVASDGLPAGGGTIGWTSSDEHLATVSPFGLVRALRRGEVTISASHGDLSASSTVTILREPALVGSIEILPAPVVWVGRSIQLEAIVLDIYGEPIPEPEIEWTTSRSWVLSVDPNGLVQGVGPGDAEIIATIGDEWTSLRIRVIQPTVSLPLAELELLLGDTRILKPRIEDWDESPLDGWPVSWSSTDEEVVTVDEGRLTAVGEGSATIVATAANSSAQVEVQVVALRFEKLSAAERGTCGLTVEGRLFCWGWHTAFASSIPAEPFDLGQRRFREVSVGAQHVCVIDREGAASCFGANYSGQLGNGTRTHSYRALVPVSGGLELASLSAAKDQTCGLTVAGDAYCWGGSNPTLDSNRAMVLALGWPAMCGLANSVVPVAVEGGPKFATLSTSVDLNGGLGMYATSCGLTSTHQAYCWGDGWGGGSSSLSSTPSLVPGGHLFSFVRTMASTVAGTVDGDDRLVPLGHACAVELDGRAYCWGSNRDGQLGSGSGSSEELMPTLVAGGHRFHELHVQVSPPGDSVSCGLTTDGEALCWGKNRFLLPDAGEGPSSEVPLPVGGAHRFTSLALGPSHLCGIATTGKVYCWGDNGQWSLGTGVQQPVVSAPTLVLGQVPDVEEPSDGD